MASAACRIGKERCERIRSMLLERNDGTLAAVGANAPQGRGRRLKRRGVVATKLGYNTLHSLACLGQALRKQRGERQVAGFVTPGFEHVGIHRPGIEPLQGGAHHL
jgi:hypothetical protein